MEHLWGPWSWSRCGSGKELETGISQSFVLICFTRMSSSKHETSIVLPQRAALLHPRILVTNVFSWNDQSQPRNNHSYRLLSSEGQVSLVLLKSFVERPCWTVIPTSQLTNHLHSGFLPLDSSYHFRGILMDTLFDSTTPVIVTLWWFSEFLEWQLHNLLHPHLSTSPVPPQLWVFSRNHTIFSLTMQKSIFLKVI